MKYLLITATLLSLTACCACQDKPKTSLAESKVVTSPTLQCYTAKVGGMTCEACAETISENLKKQKDIKYTQIDVTTGTVKIFADKSAIIKASDVKSVVDKSGYQFQSLTPSCN